MAEDNKKYSFSWTRPDSLKSRFIDSMEDGLARTWLELYFSGFSIEKIAEMHGCSVARVLVSLRSSVEKYNRFFREEKEKANANQKNTTIKTELVKQAQNNKTEKAPSKVPFAQPVKYIPSKQSRRIFSKLKKRIDVQFEKKFYIGDIVVSEEEYNELLEYTRCQLRNVTVSSSALKDAPILAVALVQIGIRCYNGNFWGNALKQELKVVNNQIYQRFLGESFINTMKAHEKFILDESERVKTILFHSFVTNYYSKGLYELLFQYYVNDLERDINRNDKNQMQALMSTIQLRAEMSEEESEAFTDQFTGRGSRAYKLRQHTLQAITANPSHSSMRLRRIIRLIDKAFWKDSVPEKPVSRLTILFKEWLNDSPTYKREYNLYKSGFIRNRGKKHFSSPYLYADIKNTAFSLVLPPQIVRQELADDLVWHITVQNTSVIDIPVSTYPVLTGFKTEEKRIPIPDDLLFSEINCTLRSRTEVAKMFPPLPLSRSRMFDMEGDYATRLFKIPMCVYTRKDFSVKSPALLDKVSLGSIIRWDLEFVDGDILIFSDGNSLIAGERYTDGLTKRGVVDNAYYLDSAEKKVAVYSRIPELLLTIPKSKTVGTIVDVNGKRYRLSGCESDEFEAGDSKGVRAFLLPLSQFSECSKNSENHIIVDAPGGIYAKEYSFVYVPDLKAHFDGSPYVFQDRGTLIFPDDLQVSCVGENATNLHGENGFQFSLEQNSQIISAQINQSIVLEFIIPVFLWSYDEAEWHIEPMGDIWHSDFKSHRKLFFRSPISRLEFGMDDDYDDSDDESEQHVIACEKRGDGVFVLDLTRFHSWITRDRVAHRINMRLGQTNYEFARVYARSFVTSCDLLADYQAGCLICSGQIIGKGDYFVDITHLQAEQIIVEKGRISDGKYQLATRLKNGEYLVDFYETEDDDDLFDEISYLPIHSFKKHLINPNDLSDNCVRVMSFKPMYYSNIHTKLAVPLWITNLELIGPHSYEGHMKDAAGTDYLVKIEFSKEKDFRYFNLYYWDEYDEAYLDFLFDTESMTLVKEEEPSLRPSVRYRRYKILYDTDFYFYGSVEQEMK